MTRGHINVLASAAALALLAGGAAARRREPMLLASSQCTADTDCKGERICSGGRCVDPQAASAAAPPVSTPPVSTPPVSTPPPAPPPAKASVSMPGPGAAPMAKEQLLVCSDNEDCGAGLLCRRGDCVKPAPPPAAPAAARPAAIPATFAAPASAAVPARAPASAPAQPLRPGSCVNDVDCPGDALCMHNACTFPQSAAAVPASSTPDRFKAPSILSVRRYGAAP